MVDKTSRPANARILTGESGAGRIWGMTGRERLDRGLKRVKAGTGAGNAALFRDDFVYDEVLLRALLAKPGVLLVAEDGSPAAVHPVSTDAAIDAALLKGDAPALAQAGLQPI